MKKLILFFLSLLPLFAMAQAPTSDSTLISTTAVTLQMKTKGANASNMQIGFFNPINSKAGQLVTGYQFNNYIGTATAAAIAGAGHTYTNGYGLNLSGFQFSVDTTHTTGLATWPYIQRFLTQANAASTYVSLTGSYSNPSWITALAWSKITGAPSYAPTFTVTAPLTYSSNVIGISQATTSTNGYLSSTDWNTFNGKLAPSGTTFIGTTSHTLNRASGTENLAGIGTLAMGGALSGATTIAASAGITAQTLALSQSGTGFLSPLTINNPGDPGTGATRLTIGNSVSSFLLQAYGSTAGGILNNAASIYANSGSGLIFGANTGMGINMFVNNNFGASSFSINSSGNTTVAGTLTNTGLATGSAGDFVVNGGSGLLVTRTASQVLSDIGAAPASGTVAPNVGVLKIPFGTFIADGDSFVYGAGVTSPDKAFIPQLEILSNQISTNYGVGGIGVKEVNYNYYTHSPATGITTPEIVYVGINNLRNSNSAYKTQNVQSGISNLIANQFMDAYVAANSGSITQGGTWSTLTTTNTLVSKSVMDSYGSPLKTTTSGSTLTFAWTGDNLQVLTYAVDASHNFGSFKITVDGVDKLTYSPNGKGDDWYYPTTGTYDFRTPAAIGVFGLGSGSHTVVITSLSSSEIDIDGIGRLLQPSQCAPLYIGHILRANATGYAIAPAYGSDANVNATNLLLDQLIFSYQKLGYPVAMVQTDKFTNVNTDISSDGLHYNDQGNYNIAKAYMDNVNRGNINGNVVLNTAIVSAMPTGGYPYYSRAGTSQYWRLGPNGNFSGGSDNIFGLSGYTIGDVFKVDGGTGKMSFNFSPTVPTPTGSSDAVPKAYVDGKFVEGTWTPTATPGVTSSNGRYTRIGNMIYASFQMVVQSSVSVGVFSIGGLPITNSANSYGSVIINSQTVQANPLVGFVPTSSTSVYFNNLSTPMTDANFSGKSISGTIIYSATN